ncbi:class III signal peptide-containing protein [Methanobrevibacter sp.]|uniref:class III signal peptide-containing protein n=1 Tax=Methanobrevibacter sp. TaxID=66852 RepID=UPI0025DD64AE|nr:class III signal peptide-containing protein [Methanobrevibacter sp.]
MKDNHGQISLEYLLIFSISLILLIVFTLPLVEQSIQNTLDVSESMNMASDLSKLSQAIQTVYGQGQGSRQSVDIISQRSNTINIASNYATCDMELKDKSHKLVKVDFNSNLPRTSVQINKGTNKIIVDWPSGSENMKIYKV